MLLSPCLTRDGDGISPYSRTRLQSADLIASRHFASLIDSISDRGMSTRVKYYIAVIDGRSVEVCVPTGTYPRGLDGACQGCSKSCPSCIVKPTRTQTRDIAVLVDGQGTRKAVRITDIPGAHNGTQKHTSTRRVRHMLSGPCMLSGVLVCGNYVMTPLTELS